MLTSLPTSTPVLNSTQIPEDIDLGVDDDLLEPDEGMPRVSCLEGPLLSTR
jgi:hypothetical protein